MSLKLELSAEQHRGIGIDLNAITWRLLEHQNRTADEDEKMVHAAHASAYHWSVGGSQINTVRGDWLVSRVYIVLGRSNQALHYAQLCYDGTQALALDDFDLAYSEESMARALACSGILEEAATFYTKAKQAGRAIVDPEDRKIFESDFAAGPWYGLPGAEK